MSRYVKMLALLEALLGESVEVTFSNLCDTVLLSPTSPDEVAELDGEYDNARVDFAIPSARLTGTIGLYAGYAGVSVGTDTLRIVCRPEGRLSFSICDYGPYDDEIEDDPNVVDQYHRCWDHARAIIARALLEASGRVKDDGYLIELDELMALAE